MRMDTRPVKPSVTAQSFLPCGTESVVSAKPACVQMDLMAVALSVLLFTTLSEDLLIAALPAQTVSARSQR